MAMKECSRRLRALLGRRHLDDGLADELTFHIDQQTAKNLRAGMAPDEARRQARRRFGGVNDTREHARDEVRFVRLEDTWRDVRYAWRSLCRAPGFTLSAALTLSLGIGATAAIFSVVYGVLLKPLPYPQQDRLVSLSHTAPGFGPDEIGMTASLWFTYREESRVFDAVGLWRLGTANVTGADGPREVALAIATHDALGALGVSPIIGRRYDVREDAPGAPRVALLGHGYWQRHYGGDRSIVGRSLTIDGEAVEIIGVMPREFRMIGADVDVIVPPRIDRSQLHLGNFGYGGVARLRQGVTLDTARADTTRLIRVWLDTWPIPPGLDAALFENARVAPVLVPLETAIVGDVDRMLWVVMTTIVIVWLIACANVANLLLVRAEGRQQELAVRAALGAGTRRIARSLLIESLLLGAIGGVLGVGIAYAAVRTIVALEPVGLPRVDELGIGPVVLLFTAGASVLSGLVFGVIPIARHARPRIGVALRGASRSVSDSRERHRTRSVLVVTQVALALVLLTGAGLMIRTFQALRAVDPGFARPAEIQILRVTVPVREIEDPAQLTRLQQALVDRMAAVPGVTAATFASSAPLSGTSWDPIFVEGVRYAEGQLPPVRRFRWVAPGYFATLGTPLVAGRDYTWVDIHGHHPVAIVSEGLARALWGEPAAALGHRIRESANGTWREVIGVVGDVRDEGMHQPPPRIVYWPVLLENFQSNRLRATRTASFIVRSARAGTDGLVQDLRSAVHDVGGSLPIGQTRTLADVYERSMALTSFALVMLGIAASMALVLGVIGIYGVIAYAVAQRRREIGIRLALGAPQPAVRAMFVRDGVRLAAIGVACGLVGAFAATRLMSLLLFGVSALDPVTYAAGALVLLAAAAAASFVPTLRATRASLAEVLRAQ